MVVFSKKVNGTYYVVEATPVSKARSVNIVSAYMLEPGKTPPGRTGKHRTGEAPRLPDADASWFTAKTDSANTSPADPNIAEMDIGVNGASAREGPNHTPLNDALVEVLGLDSEHGDSYPTDRDSGGPEMAVPASLQQKLEYDWNGEPNIIPADTIFSEVVTMAGAGSDTQIREANRLAQAYGGEPGAWRKRAGKVIGQKYIFDAHWYEQNGVQ